MVDSTSPCLLSGEPPVLLSGLPASGTPVSALLSAGTTAEVIPPTPIHSHRTLVLCFDGTGNQFDLDNSNVVQFFSMLSKDDPDQQLVYYQSGIGTYTIPQIMSPVRAKVAKTIDMMLGNHLDAHVMDGYVFLMQNYKAGDKICLFGFSRGAYTARALAGMIHKVGLLPRCNNQQVPFAYKMYSQDDDLGWSQSTEFKKSFSINVHVEFVGVWDTVNSVGLIPHRLPFTKTNDNIRYFRHALSLDERRVRFKANCFNRSTEEDIKLGAQAGKMPRSVKKVKALAVPDVVEQINSSLHGNRPSLTQLELQYSQKITKTDVEEVWFAGGHGDVGGGSVKNGTRNSLARIPLRWMIRQCFLANTGIMFQRSMFKQIGMDPNTLYPQVAKRPPAIYQTPSSHDTKNSVKADSTLAPQTAENNLCSNGRPFVSEEHEDLADALSPYEDQLVVAPLWWLLEVIPQKLHRQRDKDDSWDDGFVVNLGAGRHIPMQHKEGVKIKLHRSVKIRTEADGLPEGKYSPKADLQVKPEWVD